MDKANFEKMQNMTRSSKPKMERTPNVYTESKSISNYSSMPKTFFSPNKQLMEQAMSKQSQVFQRSQNSSNSSDLGKDASKITKGGKSSVPMAQKVALKPIAIPNGWNRILEKGAITYISPNRSRLRSMDDIKLYLIDAETCKCGLVCPLQPEETFSFNPCVPSISILKKAPTAGGCGKCHVTNAFEKLLPHFTPEEIAKLLKKSSKKKKKKSSHSPDDEMKRKAKHKHKQQSIYATTATDIAQRSNGPNKLSAVNAPGIGPASGFNPLNSRPKASGSLDAGYRSSLNMQYSDHSAYTGNYQPDHMYGKPKKFKPQTNISNPAMKNAPFHSQAPDLNQVNIVRPSSSNIGKSKATARKSVAKPKRQVKDSETTVLAGSNAQKKRKSCSSTLTQVRNTGNIDQVAGFSPKMALNDKKPQVTDLDLHRGSPLGTNQSKGISTAHRESKHSISLNIMASKAPPNITLPASHSNVLPTALTQGIKSSAMELSTPSSDDSDLRLSPGSSNSGASSLELEQCKPIPDPDSFGNFKAKANVYWGTKSPFGVADNDQNTPENKLAASRTIEATCSLRSNDLAIQPGGPRVAKSVSNITSREAVVPDQFPVKSSIKQPQQQISDINGVLNESTASLRSSDASNIPSIDTKPSFVSPSNPPVLNAPFSTPPILISSASSLHISSGSTKTSPSTVLSFPSDSKTKRKSGAALPVPEIKEESASPDKIKQESQQSSMVPNQKTVPSTVPIAGTASTTTGGGAAQMVLFQFVSQSGSTRPMGQTTLAPSLVSVNNPMRAQSMPAIQNVYGIPNTASMLRASTSVYQTSIAPNNSSQFLIMGSQASQALQHLALQNNAMEASILRTDNPHAMYLQNLPGYSAAAVKAGHMYTNVPVQFMAIGGSQVIGKQPQAHPTHVDGYQPIYQYYQGGRSTEAAKLDASKTSGTFVYPGVQQLTPGMPNNYVRIAPANPITRPTMQNITSPVPRFPLAPSIVKSEPQTNGPSPSPKVTANSKSQSNTKSPSNVATVKLPEKIQSVELNKMAQITETLKQEAFENSEKFKSQHQLEVEKKLLDHLEMYKIPTTQGNIKKEPESSSIPVPTSLTSPESCSSESSLKPNDSSDKNPSTVISSNQEEVETRVNCVVSLASAKGLSQDESPKPTISPPSSLARVAVKSEANLSDESPAQVLNTKKVELEETEEINLQCNEDCNTVSGESRTPTPEMSSRRVSTNVSTKPLEFQNDLPTMNCGLQNSTTLRIGDLIWGHQKGYSAWPGKLVSASQIGESPASPGKVWVKWFGEHTHSQIEISELKMLSEGLQDLESNTRRRKGRGPKKISESLEKAIVEALKDVNETVQGYNIYKQYLEGFKANLSTQPSKKLKR